jgi:SSS family solute:Na+ symporter
MNALSLNLLAVGVPWHWLDTIILGSYFAGMVMIVLWVLYKREETSQDYFLAGRNAGWVSIGSSIFASNIGSEHLVGLAGAGFVSGMAMAHWEIQAWLILVLGWVFVPFYDRIKIFTMPEFLERRFSAGSRSILSLISLVSYVLTKVAVTAYSGGVVFGTVFGVDKVPAGVPLIGGMDMFWVSAVGLVVITGIYTVLGGMKAVMYTSVLQTPVLLFGSVVILVLGLVTVGGWGEVLRLSGNKIHLIRSNADPEFPWLGVLFGSAIIGFWYWCTDQYIVQRVLSGRNQKEARRGSILAGYFKLLPVFIFLIPGMIAYALSQKNLIQMPLNPEGSPDADKAFSCLVAQLLPIGFKGVVVSGLLAALMSSLASLFNSSAALFVGDFYKKLKPLASEKHYVVIGRIATAVVVILGVVWIPVMREMGNVLYRYLQAVQGLLAPAIAAAFILGVFWKRANAQGNLWGLIVGFVLGMFRLLLDVIIGGPIAAANKLPEAEKLAQIAQIKQQYGFLYTIETVNWLYICEILLLISIATMVIVSLLTKAPSAEQLKYTYSAASPEEKAATRASWNGWDVLHTVIILGIVVVFYIYFW